MRKPFLDLENDRVIYRTGGPFNRWVGGGYHYCFQVQDIATDKIYYLPTDKVSKTPVCDMEALARVIAGVDS